jgi:uncharacterized protein YjbJ (UPF0337 family)
VTAAIREIYNHSEISIRTIVIVDLFYSHVTLVKGQTIKPQEITGFPSRDWRVVEAHMDKDRIKGAGHKAKGSIKETGGKVTGDNKTRVEGMAEKVGGKIQSAVGKVKDAFKRS